MLDQLMRDAKSVLNDLLKIVKAILEQLMHDWEKLSYLSYAVICFIVAFVIALIINLFMCCGKLCEELEAFKTKELPDKEKAPCANCNYNKPEAKHCSMCGRKIGK